MHSVFDQVEASTESRDFQGSLGACLLHGKDCACLWLPRDIHLRMEIQQICDGAASDIYVGCM